MAIAGKGWEQAAADDPGLAQGLNLGESKIINAAVKRAYEA